MLKNAALLLVDRHGQVQKAWRTQKERTQRIGEGAGRVSVQGGARRQEGRMGGRNGRERK